MLLFRAVPCLALFAVLAVPGALAQPDPAVPSARKGSISITAGYSAYGVEGYRCDPRQQVGFGSRNACVRNGSTAVTPLRFKRGEGGGGYAAVRIRANFTERWSGELAVHSHWSTQGADLPIQGPANADASLSPFVQEDSWASGLDVGAEYAFLDGPFRPSATLGVGVVTFGKNGSMDIQDAGLSPVVLVGGGVEQAIANGWFVRLDGRLRQAFDGGELLARGAEFSGGVGVNF